MIFHKEPPIWQNSERRTKPISVAENNKPSEMISGISEDALETLAEALYPDILEFFNSEEGQKEFAEWKASQQNKT